MNAQSQAQPQRATATDHVAFWEQVGRRLDWIKPFTQVKDVSFARDDLHIRWYHDGELNAAVNCLDRHLPTHAQRTAIVFEGDEPGITETITYQQLYERVCRFANTLRSLGVRKGDRVTIYLPMIPDAAVAMLACARIGAIHSVVFGGFSPDSLAGRVRDCTSKVIITADEGRRGGRRVALKNNVDAALTQDGLEFVEHVLVVRNTGAEVNMQVGRDLWYEDLAAAQPDECEPEVMNAEDPLFILYTSGSTGSPKGVLHTTGGYVAYASHTFDLLFHCGPDDLFWCTADVGWVTGHSYVVYGPLSNGVSVLMFEGVPNYPSASRPWEIIDRHNVTVFYTAPTAIRASMREGDDPVKRTARSSLRLLGTVGEPINPEAWSWYYHLVGDGRCPIVDTWWQTETGGALIAPMPQQTELKPGSASQPLPGIEVGLVDTEGQLLHGAAEGALVLLDSWPGQMRTVYGDHQRFIDTYFSTFPGCYFTGDGARRDADGDYWITGRVDDVLNVSGHRLGSAEVESALVAHPQVAEAAVVGCPHAVKGQGIYAFVTLKAGSEPTDTVREELRQCVRSEIGPIATPDFIQWAPGLPKTRSGKIMRRILRKIAANEHEQLGDTSTLADPNVVRELIDQRLNT